MSGFPESGPQRLITACRSSAITGREQMQQMNVRRCRYSITSSARSRSVDGTVSPVSLAVLKNR
jgi:hypothetical protein